MAYPEDRTEGVGPGTHVGYRTEVFKRSVFLLKGIPHRIALSQHFDFLCLNLDGLAAAYRLDQGTFYCKAGSGGDLCYQRLVE